MSEVLKWDVRIPGEKVKSVVRSILSNYRRGRTTLLYTAETSAGGTDLYSQQEVLSSVFILC